MTKRAKIISITAITLAIGAQAQAGWDWNSAIARFANKLQAALTGQNPDYVSREVTVFGPMTFIVGEQNISKTFPGDKKSKFRLRVRSNDKVDVEFELNSKKQKFTLNGKQKKHDQTVQLDLNNTFKLLSVAGKAGTAVTISVTSSDIELPPNPVEIAPQVSTTSTYDIASSTAFIYSGENPIQTGVEPGSIKSDQVSILKGKVIDGDGNPLFAVVVTALGHPEYGQTLTRENGEFDFAVNGGSQTILSFSKAGYLSATRKVIGDWREFSTLPQSVALIESDERVTRVQVGSGSPSQIAFGSLNSDQDGSRKAAVFFPSGTSASLVLPDGSTSEATTLSFRATEFSVGTLGNSKRPADLPDNVPGMYSISLNADEAIAANATAVQFSNPVYHYVENFLGLPVGSAIPVGHFNETTGGWNPQENGRVIKVLSVAGGAASIDIGDGRAASAAELATIGMSESERRVLAANYATGVSLWRSAIRHFSVFEMSLNQVSFTQRVNLTHATSTSPTSFCPSCLGHGQVSIEKQTVIKSVPVAGTDYQLTYTSARAAGRKDEFALRIPISGQELGQTTEIYLTVTIAGLTKSFAFAPLPNQHFDFVWDGKDAYGRQVTGSQTAFISLEYFYPTFYGTPYEGELSFGSEANTSIAIPARYPFIHALKYSTSVGSINSKFNSMAGWSFDVHHVYDSDAGTVYRGDGGVQSGISLGASIDIFAGNGQFAYAGDGGPAPSASFRSLRNAVELPSGKVIVLDEYNLRAIEGGTISHFAGGGTIPLATGPLEGSDIGYPYGIAANSSGHLYFTTQYGKIVRIIGDRIEVIGGGNAFPSPTTTPRRINELSLVSGEGVVTDDGLFYSRSNGILLINTNSQYAYILPATEGMSVSGLAYSRFSKKLFFVANGDVYELSGGVPRLLVAHTATSSASNVAVGHDGTVYFSTSQGALFKLEATPVPVNLPYPIFPGTPIVCLRDGTILVRGGIAGNRLYKLNLGYPTERRSRFTVPSPNGSELYDFSPLGHHLQTRDTRTDHIIYNFQYDTSWNLTSITDRAGRITTIARSGQIPIAITSSYGVTTNLTTLNNELTSIAAAGKPAHQFAYTNGLMTAYTSPAGRRTENVFDAKGRLTSTKHPNEGTEHFDRGDNTDQNYFISYRSESGVPTTYHVFKDDSGNQTQRNFYPEGTYENIQFSNLFSFEKSLDGSTRETVPQSDPRFGQYSIYPLSETFVSPSGLMSVIQNHKSVSYLAPPASEFAYATGGPFHHYILSETSSLNGATWSRTYNSEAREESTRSPVGRVSKVRMNSRSQPTYIEVPGQIGVNASYDPLGNLKTLSQGGRTTELEYDSRGYLAKIKDSLGRETKYTRDTEGRATSVELPGNRTVSVSYDADGNLISLTPPGRSNYVFAMNSVGLLDSFVVPDEPNPTVFNYRLDRQLASVERPDGRVASFSYSSSSGRLEGISITAEPVPDDPEFTGVLSPSADLTFNYSGMKLTRSERASGTSSAVVDMSWDGALLKKLEWTGEIEGLVEWEYDNNLRPRVATPTITTATGEKYGERGISYHFDQDGLFTGHSTITLDRDPSTGLVSRVNFVSPTEPSGFPNQTDEYLYNEFAELTSYRISRDRDGAELYRLLIGRDNGGRITSRIKTKLGITTNETFAFDPSGRLSKVVRNGSETTYTFDSNGNRLTRTHGGTTVTSTYNEKDQLLTQGSIEYFYSKNGERVGKYNHFNGQLTTYRYDGLGNLIGATLPDGRQIEYVLDAQNRRVLKKVNGVKAEGYIYLDGLRVAARNIYGVNPRSQFYVYINRSTMPEIVVDSLTDEPLRVATDERGTPQFITNFHTGQLLGQLEVDEFGRILSDTQPQFPFKFGGCLWDFDTQLCHFGTREYDPEVGRWLQRDPIGFAGGDTNLYGYVLNDPVNFTDPDGREPFDIYPSITDAATDALRLSRILSNRERVEFGGYIYRAPSGEGFYYKHPIAGTELEQDPGTKTLDVVAAYHTHLPPGTSSISEQDFDFVKSQGVPGFLSGSPTSSYIDVYGPGVRGGIYSFKVNFTPRPVGNIFQCTGRR